MNRRICSVFTIEFDRRQSLMLVRFAGTFGPDDLATLDELSDVFIAAEHPTRAPYDFTAVEYIDMPPEVMAMRAGQAQFCSHMRQAVVAPQAEIFGLVRLYGTYQSAAGFGAAHDDLEPVRGDGLARCRGSRLHADRGILGRRCRAARRHNADALISGM
jgi:hypothetical protein